MRDPKPAKIHTVTNRNGTITYRVDVGKDETGKRITHGFQSKSEAEAFKKKHDEALGLNVTPPAPEQDVPRALTEAKLYEIRNPSGAVTYRIDFKDGHGKRVTQGFQDKGKAEQFRRLINEKLVASKKADLTDLAGVHRHEILAGVEKLKTVGATITDAVDFYLKFAKPVHGNITVQEGITLCGRRFLQTTRQSKKNHSIGWWNTPAFVPSNRSNVLITLWPPPQPCGLEARS